MRIVKAAAVQLRLVLYSREGTVDKIVRTIHQLGQEGVQFATFPETVVPYCPYFCIEHVRMVGKDNAVTFDGVALQIAKQPGRATCAGLYVTVRHHLDRQRTRFPTRTLDAGKRRRRPQLPQAPLLAAKL